MNDPAMPLHTAIVLAAQRKYGDNFKPQVIEGEAIHVEGGAWIAGWVWVSDAEIEGHA